MKKHSAFFILFAFLGLISCKNESKTERNVNDAFSVFTRTVELPYKILSDSGFSLSEQIVNSSVPFYIQDKYLLSDSFITKYRIVFDSLPAQNKTRYYAYARLNLSDSCIAIIVAANSTPELPDTQEKIPSMAIFKLFTYDLSGKQTGELEIGKAFPDLDGNGITEYVVIDKGGRGKIYYSDGKDAVAGSSQEASFDIYGLPVTRLTEAFAFTYTPTGVIQPDGPDNEYSNVYTNDKKESISTFFSNITSLPISSPIDYTKCSSSFSGLYKNAWFYFDETTGITFALVEKDSSYFLAATQKRDEKADVILKEVFEIPNPSVGMVCLVYQTKSGYFYEAYSYDSEFNPGRLVFVSDDTKHASGKSGDKARSAILEHYRVKVSN